MKKILLSFFATSAIFYSVNAQTKISFETSEGYSLGSLDGQKGWAVWGDAVSAMTQVTNLQPTDGANSYRLVSDEYYTGDMMGIEKQINAFSKTDLSLDIRIDELDGSDQAVDLYDVDYNPIASFYFDYEGGINAYDGTSYQVVGTWSANTVYKLKYLVDFTTNQIEYYLNGNLVLTGSIVDAVSLDIIDLTTDNYSSGYIVDNIQIADATLATSDVSKKDIFTVYPNPVVDVVNFDLQGKVTSVEVYDAAGKLVKSANDGAKSLNVSNLAKGSYLVKVNADNQIYTKKVIKK